MKRTAELLTLEWGGGVKGLWSANEIEFSPRGIGGEDQKRLYKSEK